MAEYNSVNLGRIMPKYTGDYSTTVNYNTLDIVFYEGNSYIAKQPSRNQEPKADSAYWGLSSSKGEKGDKGDKGDIGPKGDKGDTPDITVGGRNLLANSAFLNGFTGWKNENNSWTIDGSTYKGNPIIKSPTTTDGGSRLIQWITNPPASGSKVTVSFNARGNDSNSILLVVLFNANAINIPLTSSFSRYTVSFTIPSDFGVPQIYFWNLVDGNNVFLNSIKLEEGNIPTDWTPAPEDVQSDITKRAIDTSVVHNTGNETVAGDKTFTGTLVANNPITGTLSIAMLPQKDLNSATVTGKYKINSTYSNTPSQMPNGAFIDVLNFDSSLIYQVIVARDISDTLHKSTMWVRMRLSDGWGDWQSISKDDNVLHNSGNETVAGDKTFTGNTTLATTTILAGNYGLRVTPSGFQKTTDGQTWVSANI